MNSGSINNKGEAQLFSNPVLEKLTKTRPWVIYIIYLPLSVWMLLYSFYILHFSISFITGFFIAAVFTWTLLEYFAHRYLFHFHAQSKLGQRIVYIFHGNHHEYPRDKNRLFMPPLPSVILAITVFSIIWCFSYLLTNTGNYAYIFFPGFITGYLIYVSMHYAIHAFAPPRRLKALWRNHNLHHYKYPDKAFGVSSPFWDIIFRTQPAKEASPSKDMLE